MAVIEATDHQPEPESYATGASRALIPGRRTSSFAGVSTIDGPKPEDGSCGGGLVDAVCFPRSPQPVSPVSGSASPTSSPVPVEGCQHHPQQHHQGHHQGHHQHHCHPHPDHQADQQHPLRQNPPEHQILTSTNTLTTFTNLTDTLTNNNLNHNNHNNPNQNPNTHPNTNPNPNLHSLTRIPTVLQPPLPWHTRLHHFTFAWYAVTLSTSGIALTLSLIPKRFPGLSEIGLGIFLLDLLFFLFITLAITLRFTLHGRETLKRAFTRPGEALFVPTFSLSLAAILLNVGEYGRVFLSGGGDVMGGGNGGSGEGGGNGGAMRIGGPMARFMEVAFWTYLALTFGSSVVQYHLLFAVKEERRLMISSMTPAWILPIFPVMLAGSLAGSAARGLEAGRALGVLAAGLAAQGLGILFSVFFYATYLGRLMAFGLPAQRPGMFIAVGPPSFTWYVLVRSLSLSLSSPGLSDFPPLFQIQQTTRSRLYSSFPCFSSHPAPLPHALRQSVSLLISPVLMCRPLLCRLHSVQK